MNRFDPKNIIASMLMMDATQAKYEREINEIRAWSGESNDTVKQLVNAALSASHRGAPLEVWLNNIKNSYVSGATTVQVFMMLDAYAGIPL